MKEHRLKIIIAILALSTLQMAATGTTPALAGMAADFPDVSSAAIQMTLSLPALFVVPFAFFGGSLVTIISKKKLLLTGVVLVSIGGLVPALVNHFTSILILRAVLGIGVGLIMPILPSVVTDYFEGHKRNTVMGLIGALTCGGGIFNSLIGGILAAYGWRYNFLVYLTTIPIFLVALLFIPNEGLVSQDEQEKVRIPSRVIYICIVALAFTTAKFAFTLNISMFINQEHLGDAAITGLVSSVYTAGGFISGIIFGKLAKIIKQYILGAGMLFAAAGMLMVFLSVDMIMLFIGAFLLGTALGIVNPRFNVMIADVASPKSLALSLALCTAMFNFGQFLSPITFNALGGLFGMTMVRQQFLIAAAVLFLMGFSSLIINYIMGRVKKRIHILEASEE